MFTEFLRDHLFTVGWYGLMAFVWLGWSQEAPPKKLRVWLGVASVVGLGLAVFFGIQVARHWSEPAALDTRLGWYIALVAAEVVAAGVGAIVLARRGASRWIAWWVGMVVAVHFIPLGFILSDPANLVLGLVLTGVLVWLVPRLRADDRPTSRLVGPVLGFSLLGFAVVSALMALPKL